MKLAIVEDIKEIRESYEALLLSNKEIETLLTFSNGEEFLEYITEKTAPDLVLMDIGLPGISGIECIKKLKASHPNSKVIMLSVYNDSDRIFKSLCAGASGYLLKNSDLKTIEEAILSTHHGNAHMSPSIARKVIDYFNPKPTKKELLTTKEKQIVAGLTDGLSYKLIADRLEVSINTIRKHITNIYKKLEVHSKGEVISKSLKGEI